MRIIYDNAYLVSLARANYGQIVACRAINGDLAVGKHFGDIISLNESEIGFVITQVRRESSRSICLLCRHDGREKVVAVFDFLYRTSSLVLTIVFDLDATSVSKVLLSLGEDMVALSPSLRILAEGDGSFSKEDHEVFAQLSYIYGCIVPLCEVRAMYAPDNPEVFRSYFERAADFIGVELNYATRCELDTYISTHKRVVFSGGFLAASFLVSAMLARRYSKSHTIDVAVIRGNGELSLAFSFDTDESESDIGLAFLAEIAETYGIFFNYTVRDGRFEIGVCPFYSDVGLEGVKERDPYPILSDFL